MKKISSIVLLLAATTLFTGCVSEEDDLFDKSAAERLNEISKTYTERLSAPSAGWVLEYYPKPDVLSPTDDDALMTRGYMLLAKFNNGGSVDMGMDISATNFAQKYLNTQVFGGYVSDKSTWNVITDMGPVLSFNSYNKCMHVFSDPIIYQTGTGLEGDYEFVIIDLPEDGDIAMLKGKKRGTYIRMSKLDEGTDFEAYAKDVKDFTNYIFSPQAPNNCIFRHGDTMYKIDNAATGIMNIYPYDGDNIADEDFYPFLITKRGGKYYLRFRDKLKKGEEDENIQEFVYNEEDDIFYGIEDNNLSISGPDALTFFNNHLENGKRWQMRLSDSMSDDVKAIVDGLKSDMINTSSKYEFDIDPTGKKYGLSLLLTDEGLQIDMDIMYKNKNQKRQVTLSYLCTYGIDDNGLTVNYVEPLTTGSTNMLNTFPKIGDLLSLLSDTYTVKGLENNFNLLSVKLTSISDTNKWCTFNNIK